jgi:hypothetical protein
MSTQFTNRQWRLPNEENKSKVSNYSLSFDGSGIVTVPTNNSFAFGTGGFTINVWVKITSDLGDKGILDFRGVAGSSNAGALWKNPDETLSWYTLGQVCTTSTALSLNTWYFITVLNTGSNTSIYINGTSDASGSDSVNYSATNLKIGDHHAYSAYKLVAKLDALSIFNYPLSSSQVTTLYGSSSTGIGNPMSLSPKPVAYYPLGDQDAFNGADYLVPNSSLKDYVFDFGSNGTSHVALGLNSALPTTAISISFWAKATVDSQSYKMIYLADKGAQGSSDVAIYICPTGGSSVTVKIATDTGFAQPATAAVFNDNKWHHVVATWNGSLLSIYTDNDVSNPNTASLSGTISYNTTTSPKAFIGTNPNSLSSFFQGNVSNFQIFSTALPATGSNSVETLYNNGSPLTSMTGFTSLVSWYKLDASDTYDSSTGNWTIEDHAGSNDGTSSGMTQANLVQSDLSFTSGYSPYALQLDGTDDYINCGHINLTGAFSLSFWTKYTTTSVVNVITQNNSGEATFGMYQLTDGKIRFWVTSSGSYNASNEITANTATNNGNWNNIILINDGTNLKIYINGSLDNSSSNGVSSPYNGTANFWIGGVEAGGSTFNGSISNVSVWNTALTSSQVSEIYNEGVPSNLNNHSAYSNLVSWWQLGSNSSFNTNWTVLDEKGSNNGTSANMTEDDIVDGVNTYGGGTSSGMGGDEVIGDAPYSTSNSLSVNMDVEDRVTDTPS